MAFEIHRRFLEGAVEVGEAGLHDGGDEGEREGRARNRRNPRAGPPSSWSLPTNRAASRCPSPLRHHHGRSPAGEQGAAKRHAPARSRREAEPVAGGAQQSDAQRHRRRRASPRQNSGPPLGREAGPPVTRRSVERIDHHQCDRQEKAAEGEHGSESGRASCPSGCALAGAGRSTARPAGSAGDRDGERPVGVGKEFVPQHLLIIRCAAQQVGIANPRPPDEDQQAAGDDAGQRQCRVTVRGRRAAA